MDISYEVVELECPECAFIIELLIKQVMAEEVIICPGCYAEIQLVDERGSASRA